MIELFPPRRKAAPALSQEGGSIIGFVFSGDYEALAKLKIAGEAAGLRLRPYSLQNYRYSLIVFGDEKFRELIAVMALWSKACDGTFGEIEGQLISVRPSIG